MNTIKEELFENINLDDFKLLHRNLLKYSEELNLQGDENSLLQSDKLAFLAYVLSLNEDEISNYLNCLNEESKKITELEKKLANLIESIDKTFFTAKEIFFWVRDNHIFTPSILDFGIKRPGTDKLEQSKKIWKIFEIVDSGDSQDVNLKEFFKSLIVEFELYRGLSVQPVIKTIFPKYSIKRGAYLDYVKLMQESENFLVELKKSVDQLSEVIMFEDDIYKLKNSLVNASSFQLKDFLTEELGEIFK